MRSYSVEEQTRRHEGFTLWFTGLSGAGKTTLAEAVRRQLLAAGRLVEVLDGDEVRKHFSRELGFSKADRDVNVRRIGFVARLLSRNGVIAISAAISPYRDVRDEVRRAHEAAFVEVFVDCPLETLIIRDPKGLYARALRGEIQNVTGLSDPYEVPEAPEIHLRTDAESVNQCRDRIIQWLASRGLV